MGSYNCALPVPKANTRTIKQQHRKEPRVAGVRINEAPAELSDSRATEPVLETKVSPLIGTYQATGAQPEAATRARAAELQSSAVTGARCRPVPGGTRLGGWTPEFAVTTLAPGCGPKGPSLPLLRGRSRDAPQPAARQP